MAGVRPVTLVILQARLDSSRLPSKALLDLGGQPLICHAMSSLRRVRADEWVLATEEGSRSGLAGLAASCGFRLFVGPKENVLGRFALAARHYKADVVIRATGDNPLVSAPLANDLLGLHCSGSHDYSGYLGMPSGMGVEIIKARSLAQIDGEECDAFEREHVCPRLYNNQDRFRINRPMVSEPYRLDARVTVDTMRDYEAMQALFSRLYHGQVIEDDRIMAYLRETVGA